MSDDLDQSAEDRWLAVTKGAASLVPIIGGPLAELVTSTIPNQRHDRIVDYVRKLDARMSEMEKQMTEAARTNPEKIDMIETGAYQAARATSKERISRIVEVVVNGLKADDADVIRRKRLLGLLGEIDDDEIAILNAYGQSYGSSSRDAWETISRPDLPTHDGKTELVELNALYELGRDNLLRLNLLRRNFGNVKRGEYPEFDKQVGGFKGRVEVSTLGRMLLRQMGFELPFNN